MRVTICIHWAFQLVRQLVVTFCERNDSGNQASTGERSAPVKARGATPTIRYCTVPRVIMRPTTLGSEPNPRFQRPYPSTTTRCGEVGESSVASKKRPIYGRT